MKVVLIGSGNVSTHLAKALNSAGHEILQVYSRNIGHATELALQLQAQAVGEISELSANGDIYIIAVSDDAISELASFFPYQQKLLVHTSGTADISVLEGASDFTGVFYPLQTFSKQKDLNFREIPLLVEGLTAEVTEVLVSLASDISDHVQIVNSSQRRVLHLAAVFACNFSNHMFAIATRILNEEGLSFDLLGPLIRETVSKALALPPEQVQTGPAVRRDYSTLERQLQDLASKPQLQELYEKISRSIMNF